MYKYIEISNNLKISVNKSYSLDEKKYSLSINVVIDDEPSTEILKIPQASLCNGSCMKKIIEHINNSLKFEEMITDTGESDETNNPARKIYNTIIKLYNEANTQESKEKATYIEILKQIYAETYLYWKSIGDSEFQYYTEECVRVPVSENEFNFDAIAQKLNWNSRELKKFLKEENLLICEKGRCDKQIRCGTNNNSENRKRFVCVKIRKTLWDEVIYTIDEAENIKEVA